MKQYYNYPALFLATLALPAFAPNVPTGWELKRMLLSERNDPACRALLDTIAFAEGTYHARAAGYKMRYPSGTMFTSFDAHPALVICARSRQRQLCSTAAGRYMFLESTWNTVADKLDLSDFSPLNQDIGALFLMYEKDALQEIKKGNIREAIDRIKTIWASLPGAPYNQPVRKYETLRNFFVERRSHYKKYLKGRE